MRREAGRFAHELVEPRDRRPAAGAAASCLVILLIFTGCMRQDRRIQQQHDALQSLSSTTRAIAGAWLAGHVSGTYTQTALEHTFLLVEQTRATLASKPDTLIDPRGARLSAAAEQLARLIARIIDDVRSADADAVRTDVAALPFPIERNSP